MVKIERFVVGFLETNCYLVYDDETKAAFLIDPGSYDKKISASIAAKSLRVQNIINTHAHPDHTAGNDSFGYEVLMHENDKVFPGSQRGNVRFLKDGDILKSGNIEFKVVHTPGHTPGSICLKLEGEGKVFTGDTLFREGIGRTDLPYGSEEDIFYSINRRLIIMDSKTVILPGHGPHSTIAHERDNNPYLER